MRTINRTRIQKWAVVATIGFLASLVLTFAANCNGQDAHSTQATLAVSEFVVNKDVKLPDSWIATMMTEIKEELTKTNRFSDVTVVANGAAPPASLAASIDARHLVLTGVVTKYDEGNREARYLIGFGAGKVKIVSHIKLVDPSSNAVLLDRDVDGKVIMGFFGGNSHGATRGLAIEVAKVVKNAVSKH